MFGYITQPEWSILYSSDTWYTVFVSLKWWNCQNVFQQFEKKKSVEYINFLIFIACICNTNIVK